MPTVSDRYVKQLFVFFAIVVVALVAMLIPCAIQRDHARADLAQAQVEAEAMAVQAKAEYKLRVETQKKLEDLARIVSKDGFKCPSGCRH